MIASVHSTQTVHVNFYVKLIHVHVHPQFSNYMYMY